MSEVTTAIGGKRISLCRMVHLGVRLVLAINVCIFATSLSAKASRIFMSSYLAMPLVYLALVSSFILPIIATVEGIAVHGRTATGGRNAVIDVTITVLWVLVLFILVFYKVTHFAYL